MRVLFLLMFLFLFSLDAFSQHESSINRSRVILSANPEFGVPMNSSLQQSASPSLLSVRSAQAMVQSFVQNWTVDLGTAGIGEQLTWTIDFYGNAFDQPIGGVSFSGDNQFVMVSDSCTGANVGNGRHCYITVNFRSNDVGDYMARVRVPWTGFYHGQNNEVIQVNGVSNFNFRASTIDDQLPEIDTENSCQLAANSSINVDSLSLDEFVDVVGIDFNLNYSSSRLRQGSYYNPTYLGMGGWTPSNVHYYDPAQAKIYMGDNSMRNVVAEVINGEYWVSSKDGKHTLCF